MFKRKSENGSLGNNLNYDVLQALARDYMIIVAVDAQSAEYNVIRCEPESVKVLERYIFANLSFNEIVDRYLEDHIYIEDRESVRNCFDLENIRSELSSRESFSMIVRKMDGDKIKSVRAEIRRYDPKSDKRFLLAVRDVDREVQLDQIRQNELKEAYKAAERASQAKNSFMYNMSHDIRSPLNAIMGYTTVANDNCEDPKMLKKCLGRIDDASHQVLSIISEILDLNELEEGVINVSEHTLTMADLERQVM